MTTTNTAAQSAEHRPIDAPVTPNVTGGSHDVWPPSVAPYTEPGVPNGATGAPPITADGVRSLSIAALVLGIVGVFFNPFAAVSIAALICGLLAVTRGNRLRVAGVRITTEGMAIAGIVLGAIALTGTAFFKAFLF